MGPLRIAHLIDTLEIGGAEVMVASLAAMQRENGHQVHVLCLLRGGALEERLRNSGVEIYCCRNNPLHSSHAGKLRTIRELWRELRRRRIDVLHCHNVTTALYGGPAGRLAGVRAIFCTRHGFYVPPERVRKERAFWKIARFCCDRVVAVSKAVHDGMAALPYARPSQLVTIPNGIHVPVVSSVAPPRSGFTLVTVARLDPPKDHPTLLRAVAQVLPRIPGLRLLVIGGGSMEKALRELSDELGIAGSVDFLGSRNDVGDWLARSHVFVLSSKSEGLPISMLEAMAAGLPMILSDVGGIGEVAGRLPAARLVRLEDPDDMAAAILDFWSRREEHTLLAAAHRRHFEEYYSAETMARGYARLYSGFR